MALGRGVASWLAVLVGIAGFAAGLSAQQAARAVSQAVVTPDDPIWAGAQEPEPAPAPAPAEQPAADAQQANGRGGGRGGAPGQPRPYNQVITAGARTDEGIFKVHRVNEQVYYEIPKAELGKDFLWVTQIKRTVAGAGTGGQAGGNRVVRWELVGNRVLLRLMDYRLVADPETPIARAVADANNPAIIRAFNVAAFSPTEDPVIDVTALFSTEVAELSVRGRVGARGLDGSRTFIEKVVSYPENINVEVSQTFVFAPDAAPARGRGGFRGTSATLVTSYSMVKLPETPMMPRLFDERVGYFTEALFDYGRDEHRALERRFITRYRLEKKDPASALSDPVKPIVYYVDPATPTKFVEAVKKGIEDWQPAFEAAGFRNAILARDAPTDDPDWSPEDARYSVVRWLPSTVENAQGPSITDPRSGEILEADIEMFHNLQNMVKNWYFVQVGPLDPRARTLPLPDDLMAELVRYVVAHEVGHTLGFQHNMKASSLYTLEQIRDRDWVRRNGHTPTLMDYSRFNYVAQPEDGIDVADLIPKIGPYDKWATMWGYRPIPGARTPDEERATLDSWARQQDTTPHLRFSTAGGAGDRGNNTEAVGDIDAVAATTLGMRNLARVSDMLLAATTTRPGDPYDELTEVYGRMAAQWVLEMNHVTQVVGGVESQQKHIGQDGPRFTTVPRATQVAALQYLATNAFRTPSILVKPELLRRMEPAGVMARVRNAQTAVMNSLFQNARLDRMVEQAAIDGAAAYAPVQMMADARRGIWSELATPGTVIDAFRRNTQRAYLDTLDNRLNGGNAASSEVKAIVKGELRALDAQLRTALTSTTDRATRLHLEDSRDAIARILDPQVPRTTAAQAGRVGGPAVGALAADGHSTSRTIPSSSPRSAAGRSSRSRRPRCGRRTGGIADQSRRSVRRPGSACEPGTRSTYRITPQPSYSVIGDRVLVSRSRRRTAVFPRGSEIAISTGAPPSTWPMSESVTVPSRRQFCAGACQLASGATLAVIATACGGSASPTAPSGPASSLVTVNGRFAGGAVQVTVSGSPLADAGGAVLVESVAGVFLLARTAENDFTAVDAVCSHESCTITGTQGAVYVCPCHGSRYDRGGRVLTGPATASLRRFPTTFTGGVVTIAL